MSNGDAFGTIAGLWRFPVKSMCGEQLQEAVVTEHGLLGDRAHALIDLDTGKVVSAKSVRLFPELLDCEASFVEAPQPGRQLPPVRITLPDGTDVASDAGDVDRVLSSFFHRNVTLARAAPDDFTIDIYHPDLGDLDPAGHRDEMVEQKLGAALFAELGVDSPVPAGSFMDVFPISVLTTSTLERLRDIRPQSDFDERRFRMNLIIDTEQPGFLENDWVGSELWIGEVVRLGVAMPDSRCVMTTLAQGDLPRDTDLLRTLARHNRIPVGDIGQFPCAGAYAAVAAPGTVRTGDRVSLA